MFVHRFFIAHDAALLVLSDGQRVRGHFVYSKRAGIDVLNRVPTDSKARETLDQARRAMMFCRLPSESQYAEQVIGHQATLHLLDVADRFRKTTRHQFGCDCADSMKLRQRMSGRIYVWVGDFGLVSQDGLVAYCDPAGTHHVYFFNNTRRARTHVYGLRWLSQELRQGTCQWVQDHLHEVAGKVPRADAHLTGELAASFNAAFVVEGERRAACEGSAVNDSDYN